MDVLAPGEKESDGTERPNGLGYIQTPTQEKNGPMVNYADQNHPETYYVPLQYEVPDDGGGVYTFEFHSITGFNPNNASSGYHPSPRKASEAWVQGNNSVAAWDVTVLGKKTDTEWEVKSGRAWADYLALTTAGGQGYQSDLNVHVLTHDGYQYKVDFEAAVPFGFIFFANNTGFMSAVTDEDTHTTTYHPIYHSFYDSTNDLDYMSSAEKIYLHKPNEVDTATEETYKIFFNAPNTDLNGIEYKRKDRTETIKTAPTANVSITGLSFNGGSHENIARAGHGGYFTFHADDEAIVTIRLDLRKAILESERSMSSAYKGSGIVEITTPVIAGDNRIYWDGKDTDGIVIPAGIYGNSNVVLATEVKRGELHFPVIDMEGLIGGLHVERINGVDAGTGNSELYNLYYNNNPLVYGTIEGISAGKKIDGAHYALSNGTKSYRAYTDRSATLDKFFIYDSSSVTTLKKDDKDYLAIKLFGNDSIYDNLSPERKAIIDAEFGKELDTYHFEAVDSRTTTMKFACEGYDGGGNQAGIDAWTYYVQGMDSQLISFALMDTNNRGIVKGQIFYDADVSSTYDAAQTGEQTPGETKPKDYLLPGVKVRLIDRDGNPLVHRESLPCFDATGHFIYDEKGNVLHKETDVTFEAITDATGTYRFTGVPYSSTENTTYYIQVVLTDVQSEVLRYTCTTSEDVKTNLVDKSGNRFIKASTIDSETYGSDGNEIEKTDDQTKIYQHRYKRILLENKESETVFRKENAQAVTFLMSENTESSGSNEGSGNSENSSNSGNGSIVTVKDAKMIGYSSTVPSNNQKDYKVVKSWGKNSHGEDTHQISDGLIVELWVWNDEKVHEEHAEENKLSRRTGALMDTQVLNAENQWSYTWKNLDDRLQYYVLEYYTKKKSDGEIIYNDRGEARKVLIGSSMPLFSTIPENSIYKKGIYGFDVNLGDYPETILDPDDNSKTRIPIQKFGDSKTHTNAITQAEKLESVDNNARQYDVTYTLTTETISGRATNVITLNNSQVYDDRTYYVWLNHQRELPDLIAQTYVEEDGKRKSHAVELKPDKSIDEDTGMYSIKGLSVSSLDAASVDNVEGNATSAFRITKDDKQYAALFTATNHGNYKTGTGTRTYQVKYVVEASTKQPVSVIADDGKLVLTDNHAIKVEESSDYIVYSWYMTIHVYDVEPDGVIEYNPKGEPVVLQEALPAGKELTWKLERGTNENEISYTSSDERASGILQNDILRVPLYKAAEDYNMGSCADIVGIAYSKDGIVDDISSLEFEDTYDSRYGSHTSEIVKEDGKAIAQSSGGSVNVELNKEDVFYYKIVVFAEDNTYQYHTYEAIDATDGVTMYTYFTMKSDRYVPIDDPKKEKPTGGAEDNLGGDNPSEDPDNFVVQTMKPLADTLKKKLGLSESDNEEITEDSEEDNRHVKGTRASLTGDYNNWILWGGIFLLSGCALVTIFLLWSRKNTKHHKRKMKSKKRKKGKGRARRRT